MSKAEIALLPTWRLWKVISQSILSISLYDHHYNRHGMNFVMSAFTSTEMVYLV